MNKDERNARLELALLLSLIVFGINGVSILLTYLVFFLLTLLGVFNVSNGQIGILEASIFIFSSSIVIGFILSNSLGKIPLKPVNSLIVQLNRLGNGDFNARLHFSRPIDSHPLFKNIENSFNRTAEELGHTEVLRNDFINNFSHEFKTPIASIAGFAKLLRNGNLSEGEREEYLAIIEEESKRLSDMASSVLNLTRIENQTILTGVTQFNLSEQIRAVVLLLVEKWTAKNLCMDMLFEEHWIWANAELLKQVWINLLDNAIKFADSGSTVSVSIAEEGDRILVSIADHGRDIPNESLNRIYNKFYQIDESRSSEGNGIGLAIAKKVCDLHNGTICATSGGGTTTFTVSLPKQQGLR